MDETIASVTRDYSGVDGQQSPRGAVTPSAKEHWLRASGPQSHFSIRLRKSHSHQDLDAIEQQGFFKIRHYHWLT